MMEWLKRHRGWITLIVLAAIYYPLFGKGFQDIVALHRRQPLHLARARRCCPAADVFLSAGAGGGGDSHWPSFRRRCKSLFGT